MRHIHASGPAILAAVLGLVATTAAADGGTITFQGQVTNTTCNIDTGAGGDQTVLLPTVSTNELAAAGDVAGRTAFQIRLSGCNTAQSTDGANTVTAFFESGPTVDPDTGTLINQDAGAGAVNIQLLGDNGQPITVGSPVDADGHQQNSQIVAFSGAPATGTGTATLRYAAQYYATGQSTAGTVTTSVQYTLAYP